MRNLKTEIASDEEVKKEIQKTKLRLKFEREVRQLYFSQHELQSIDQPEYEDYLGHFFRQ